MTNIEPVTTNYHYVPSSSQLLEETTSTSEEACNIDERPRQSHSKHNHHFNKKATSRSFSHAAKSKVVNAAKSLATSTHLISTLTDKHQHNSSTNQSFSSAKSHNDNDSLGLSTFANINKTREQEENEENEGAVFFDNSSNTSGETTTTTSLTTMNRKKSKSKSKSKNKTATKTSSTESSLSSSPISDSPSTSIARHHSLHIERTPEHTRSAAMFSRSESVRLRHNAAAIIATPPNSAVVSPNIKMTSPFSMFGGLDENQEESAASKCNDIILANLKMNKSTKKSDDDIAYDDEAVDENQELLIDETSERHKSPLGNINKHQHSKPKSLGAVKVTRINLDSEINDAASANGSLKKNRVYDKVKRRDSKKRYDFLIIILLCIVNLLNYIDRYTLAGVLTQTQKYFDINDKQAGLLQTAFICSYMILAPLFGYLGDRYPRKWIIIFGITFWSLMSFLGSFVPKDKFWLFAIIRSLVGIGEASYSCVAPTIIGDLFTDNMRTSMLAIFYLAVPVGSGLGYIVGSAVADLFGDWRFALRVTPPLGVICIILLIIFVREPKRGGAEGSHIEPSTSSLMSDVICLLKNKTFIWITFGFTFASFVLGGLSWWVPAYVEFAKLSQNIKPKSIPLLFGVVTCFSGLIGVGASSIIAPRLRTKYTYADPLLCGIGSLIAVPTLFMLVYMVDTAPDVLFWFIAAIAISAMCLSWTLVAEILLYVVYPTKRSIASALSILICHMFGDAGSPYLIGAISDMMRATKADPDTYYSKFTSLQVGLYAGPVFCVLSFGAYMFTAIYIDDDRKKVEMEIKMSQNKGLTTETNVNAISDLVSKSETTSKIYNDEVTVESNESVAPSTSQSNKKTMLGYANPLAMNDSSNLTNNA